MFKPIVFTTYCTIYLSLSAIYCHYLLKPNTGTQRKIRFFLICMLHCVSVHIYWLPAYILTSLSQGNNKLGMCCNQSYLIMRANEMSRYNLLSKHSSWITIWEHFLNSDTFPENRLFCLWCSQNCGIMWLQSIAVVNSTGQPMNFIVHY